MQTSAERGSTEASSRKPSDRELISRFLDSREESAFAEIVTRYSRLVMAVARHTLRDPHAAEDAFQAAFLVLARSAGRIRNRDSLASWLHGTTFRVSRRLLQSRLRRKEQDLPDVELPAPIWATPPRPDEQAVLDEELARLSESLRGPLVLHYLEGRTIPEIAAELKMSQSAVEGRLKRGRKALRKRLLQRGVLLSSALVGAGLTIPAGATVAATLINATVRACLKSTPALPLAPIAATTIQKIALQETAAMTRLAFMKTALICGGVAGAIGLAGSGASGTLGTVWARQDPGSAISRLPGSVVAATPMSLRPASIIQTTLAYASGEEPAPVKQVDGTDDGGVPTPFVTTPDPQQVARNHAAEIKALQDQIDQLKRIIEAQKAGIAPATPPAVAEKDVGRPAAFGPGGMEDDSVTGFQAPPSRRGMTRGQRDAAPPAASSRSEAGIREIRSQSPNEERIRQALEGSVDFQFTGQTLQEIMTYLANQENIVIQLDKTSLAEAGVDPGQEINLVISGISLKSALNLMLKDVEGAQLDYFIEDEVLTVTTKDKADETLQTVIYDVSTLNTILPEQLEDILKKTVEPQSWESEGGSATIVPIGGSVVITTSRRLHEKTSRILQMLHQNADQSPVP